MQVFRLQVQARTRLRPAPWSRPEVPKEAGRLMDGTERENDRPSVVHQGARPAHREQRTLHVRSKKLVESAQCGFQGGANRRDAISDQDIIFPCAFTVCRGRRVLQFGRLPEPRKPRAGIAFSFKASSSSFCGGRMKPSAPSSTKTASAWRNYSVVPPVTTANVPPPCPFRHSFAG